MHLAKHLLCQAPDALRLAPVAVVRVQHVQWCIEPIATRLLLKLRCRRLLRVLRREALRQRHLAANRRLGRRSVGRSELRLTAD